MAGLYASSLVLSVWASTLDFTVDLIAVVALCLMWALLVYMGLCWLAAIRKGFDVAQALWLNWRLGGDMWACFRHETGLSKWI